MKAGTTRSLCRTSRTTAHRWRTLCRRFWRYYEQLMTYRQQPTPEEAAWLDEEIEALF